MNTPLTPYTIRRFRSTVYRYFDEHGRILPWRTDYNPYHIVVSEIMLQQTQVDRVIEKFTAFITKFPAVTDLANAPLDAVLSTWQGLGYNRRAVALRTAATIIQDTYNGIIPEDPEILITLPGIGTATAASICAFAFNAPSIFLETNIRTVYIHHFLSDKKDVDDTDILPLAHVCLDRKNPRKWYSALMDYGTMLKKTVGNLSRKSTTYRKQTPFNGSRRQIRGALLKELITLKTGTAAELSKATGYSLDEITPVLTILTEEQIIQKKNRRYRIAR